MAKPRVNTEGRANLARPSVCLLLAILLAGLIATPAAQAAPPIPVLSRTTPPSPNVSLSPFVQGNSSGVITSSLPSVRLSAIRFDAETDGRTITLYGEPFCEGPILAEGTADALDHAGIQIEVEPETTTSISATQTDSSGTSLCSKTLTYKHVTELPPPAEEPPAQPPADPPSQPSAPSQPGVSPNRGVSAPPAPPRLHTVPGGFANDNTPLVTGSAPGAASVRIFTNPTCDGTPVAKGSVAQFESGLPVQVVDNMAVAFYGVAVGSGGASSRCSSPVYYVEDSTAPRTRITMGPASKTRKRVAIFRFADTAGDTPGTTFLCKLDRRKWKQCSSPLRLRRLPLKRHLVRVKATDPAGNVELKGAKRAFKVVPPLP
jgi:hypothetical protein